MTGEDLKFWNKNRSQILTSQKYPHAQLHCTGLLRNSGFPHYKKVTVVLAHCLMYLGTKKKVIGQLFPAEFSTKLASRNWGIREVDLDSTQYNGLKSIPKFAYTGTKPATDQFCCNLLCLRYKMNSVTPFLTSAGVFCEFTIESERQCLRGFTLLFRYFQSTKLPTQDHPESSPQTFWWVFEWFSVIVCILKHVGHIFLHWNPICSRSGLASWDPSYRLEFSNSCYGSWKQCRKTMFLSRLRCISTNLLLQIHDLFFQRYQLFQELRFFTSSTFFAENSWWNLRSR